MEPKLVRRKRSGFESALDKRLGHVTGPLGHEDAMELWHEATRGFEHDTALGHRRLPSALQHPEDYEGDNGGSVEVQGEAWGRVQNKNQDQDQDQDHGEAWGRVKTRIKNVSRERNSRDTRSSSTERSRSRSRSRSPQRLNRTVEKEDFWTGGHASGSFPTSRFYLTLTLTLIGSFPTSRF